MKNDAAVNSRDNIDVFFSNLNNKSSEDIKKIKRFGMSKKIPLKEKRKLFCKKCLTPYINPKIKIKKGMKTLICQKCGYEARWKVK